MANHAPQTPAPSGFPAGTMILARRGVVPIEGVATGEEVFTHRRRWMPVSATTSGTAPTVRVRCASLISGLTMTADHEFRTRISRVLLDDGQADGLSTAGWTRARDLADGHRLASPLDFGTVALPVPALPASAIDMDPGEVLRTVGIMARTKGEAATAVRPDLVDWLAAHFGEYGAGRRFPAWALTLPVASRTALLDGLVNDGSDRAQYATRMTSKSFMVGMRLLVCSLGFAGGLSSSGRPGQVAWLLNWKREGGRRLDLDWFRWHSATRVELGPVTEVFALDVAEDRSFIADGITVRAHTGR
ncbi:hypothetical protein ACFWAP_09110 [Streptomyces goshikiensis]|uniref:hypothetical protein n=1 Tax=Streptomyces goshikiensis TaxID=1942 RepID=UPI0036612EB1